MCFMTPILFSVFQAAFVERADVAWNLAWEILTTEEGWKKREGNNLEDGLVYTKRYQQLDVVYKLEVCTHALLTFKCRPLHSFLRGEDSKTMLKKFNTRGKINDRGRGYCSPPLISVISIPVKITTMRRGCVKNN